MHIANLFSKLFETWERLSFSPRNAKVGQNLSVPNQPAPQDLLCIRETLERILNENIIPFWYPQTVDLDEGGYRLNHDLHGKWKGNANKYLVTQARTVWFFSYLATENGKSEHLDAARYGYEFICNRMWDKQFGGFYWEVDSSGSLALKHDKQLYGQAFGLYALSEYAKASGDSQATTLARNLFSLMEHHAHDSQYGGYYEFLRRDWGLVSRNTKSYLNTSPHIKLMNTHLHLMEAITAYYLLTKDQIARERLMELIFINSNSVVRKTVGACTDKYRRNWVSLHGPDCERVSYGHNIENVYLLIDACNAVGIPNSLLLDLYQTLFNYSIQYGFDKEKGGFYYTGPFNEPADNRDKIWWVQAEGLISALKMYELTGDEVYLSCFSLTLDWVNNHQVDWKYGDWYAQIAENGKPSGDKAGAWKSPYHNGRAMIQCLKLLLSLIKS